MLIWQDRILLDIIQLSHFLADVLADEIFRFFLSVRRWRTSFEDLLMLEQRTGLLHQIERIQLRYQWFLFDVWDWRLLVDKFRSLYVVGYRTRRLNQWVSTRRDVLGREVILNGIVIKCTCAYINIFKFRLSYSFHIFSNIDLYVQKISNFCIFLPFVKCILSIFSDAVFL